MDAIHGAGATPYGVFPVGYAARVGGRSRGDSAQGVPKKGEEMGAALSLSRDYLSFALQECGFVDICAGLLGVTGRSLSGQGDLDASTASRVAARFGQQVAASSIDSILDIVCRPDPKYALKLLK